MTLSPCFDFLDLPHRSQKPRTTGITVMSDRGMSMAESRSLVEVAGDIADHIKLTDHLGIMRRYPEEWIKGKNALYREAGIETTTGGIPFEVSLVQGKVPRFMERIADLGFSGVEISGDMVSTFPLKDRKEAIRLGRERGLHVFSELGKKFPEQPLDAEEAVETGLHDIEMGAYMLVVEKSDILKIIREDRDTLHRIAEALPREKLIFEAGPGDWPEIARWLLTEFGPETNIENVGPEHIITLEAMRHGLNRAVEYRFFEPYANQPIPGVGQ